ncbi:MAG: BtaA family protein [Verrucomicrobiae bacterium]|nr:BtaA family protein [Verrucomicrobiae bacterium]
MVALPARPPLPSAAVPAPSRHPSRDSSPVPAPTPRWRAWTHDHLFHRNHRHRLVYNTCWEDPRIDRALLELDSSSRVVMIASAGCNALDYLLDDPAEIHAIDVNPRQIALLELKLALIARGGFDDFRRVFGEGAHPGFNALLDELAPFLTTPTRAFWSAKRHYFNGGAVRRSFYYHGSSGNVAWLLRTLVLRPRPALWRDLERLLHAGSLGEQQEAFDRLEPLFWNLFTAWLVRQPLTLSLLGVPRPQARLMVEHRTDGVPGYIREKLRHVATAVPMRDNYFWRVYVTGSYSTDCSPAYLQPAHFNPLRQRASRIHTHTGYLSDFLAHHPAPYSHYVLLDHQDWLAWHDPDALAREWHLILANSRPGTRILFRSAAPRVNYLPEFAVNRLRFHPDRTDPLHRTDRVGTYGSLYLAEVL